MTGRGLAIVAAVALAAFLGFYAVEPWLEPGPRAPGGTSYSAWLDGHRALYELLDRLGVRVNRWKAPPQGLWRTEKRIALIEPDPWRLGLERAHLDRLRSWVEDGGELVAVLPVDYAKQDLGEGTPESAGLPMADVDELLGILGFEGVSHQTPSLRAAQRFGRSEERAGGWMEEVIYGRPVFEPVAVSSSGELKGLTQGVEALWLPERGYAFFDAPAGTTYAGEVTDEGDRLYAMKTRVGAGSVTVVADPAPFLNAGLGEGDNSVFAARTVAGSSFDPVVIDEYYHGLAVQGNTGALLTRYPYSVAAFGALAAVALALWRFGYRFGPAAPDRARSRRSIVEYVDAMARLFRKGRKYRFALETLRWGALEDIRRALGLAPGAHAGVVVAAVEKRDPAAGARLRHCLDEIEGAMKSDEELGEETAVALEERLSLCRNEIVMRRRPGTTPSRTADLL